MNAEDTLSPDNSLDVAAGPCRAVLALLGVGSAMLLVACSLITGTTHAGAAPELRHLQAELTSVDGVQDVVAASSFDGSPKRRRLNVRLYLDTPAPADLVPVVTQALKLEWAFDGFTPTGYSLQVWNGPLQKAPHDSSLHIDLTPVLAGLDLPSSRIYKKDLYPAGPDLEQMFGTA